MKRKLCFTVAVLFMGLFQDTFAAQGEMGTGTPRFGTYADALCGSTGCTLVWGIDNASIGFPAGCTYLQVSSATLGIATYRIAIATMMTAKVTGKKVRFYAHAPRDNGCGVDYVELVD